MNNTKIIRILFILISCYLVLPLQHGIAENLNSFYEYEVTDVRGNKQKLEKYKGKVSLVVNTASNCGFTYQYAGLEELYKKYQDKGFVVLAFPSNDFGQQEPGDNQEISNFCQSKYSVTFPVFSKEPVSGANKQAAYKYLTEKSDKEFQGDPGWNFVKFLVNKNGNVINRFSSSAKPESETIVAAIEKALSE